VIKVPKELLKLQQDVELAIDCFLSKNTFFYYPQHKNVLHDGDTYFLTSHRVYIGSSPFDVQDVPPKGLPHCCFDILLKCSLLVPCTILVPFSYHLILFQKMKMSSPGEEMYFAKKVVHLSFLFEKGFRFHKKKNIPPLRHCLYLLHPIPHTKNVLGGGGSNGLLRGSAAGASEGGGAMLGLFRGRCTSGGRGATPGLHWGRCTLAAPGEIWASQRVTVCAGLSS